MFSNILQGVITVTLNPSVFLFMIFGVVSGITIGALPGLTSTMAMAVLLPVTFGMPADMSFALLLSVYCGAIYGGSITAILINTPGTPAAAATTFDGYPLAMKGQAGKALATSTLSSSIGGIISVLLLSTLSPILARFALRFAAPEFFALAVFGLSIIASISNKNIIKGLLAGFFGLILASVGLDPISAIPRFTFGRTELLSGVAFIPLMVGLFALPQCFMEIENIFKKSSILKDIQSELISFKELLTILPTIIKSSLMGGFIGSVPGAGGDIASFAAYNEAKRNSKKNENFGEGELKGIAAPEAANNASTGGAMIPLLSLAVPGDSNTAVLLGGLIIMGLQPGPLLFTQQTELVNSIFAIMLLANITMCIVGLIGIRFFIKALSVPKQIIVPVILTLSVVGSYSMNNSMFDVFITILFGVVGYLMIKADVIVSPIVLAVILGPMAETNYRRSLIMFDGDYSFLYTRPITIIFLLLAIFTILSSLLRQNFNIFKKRNHSGPKGILSKRNNSI